MRIIRAIISTSLLITVRGQYVPEAYGWACYRMAARRDWPQCKSLPQNQQQSCLCGIPQFVELTQNCLQAAVVNATNPAQAVEYANQMSLCGLAHSKLDSTNEVESGIVNTANSTFPTAKTKHPKFPELGYVDPISMEEIDIALSTAQWRMCNDRRAERAGAALVGFWVAVIIVKYAAHYAMDLLPVKLKNAIFLWKPIKLFRSRLINPALGKRHHSEPCLQKLGIRFPIRSFTIVLFLFAVLNYALIFTNFPQSQHNFIYPTASQQWNKSLAIRCAFMIMWKLPLIFCFSGRNNILLLLKHPWSLDTFNVFHRWIARMTIVDIIIHGVAISLVKVEQGLYHSIWKVQYWQWGICGVVIAVLIAFQSMHWISKANYEIFKLLHIVFVIVFIVATWYHVKVLPYGIKHTYAIIAIWAFDHLGRIIRILMAGPIDARLYHVSDTLSLITIDNPPTMYNRAMRERPNFLFVHMPPLFMFWQSHPFTVFKRSIIVNDQSITIASLNESTGDEILLARNKIKEEKTESKEISKSLSNSAMESSLSQSKKIEQLVIAIKHKRGMTQKISKLPEGHLRLAVDGPYGSLLPIHRFRQVICLAGGIGITAQLSYIQNIIQKNAHRELAVKLYWAVSDVRSMQWAFEILSDASPLVEIEIFTNEEATEQRNIDFSRWPITVTFGRLKCSEIIKSEVSLINSSQLPSSMSTAIFTCGPERLNDDARQIACWAIDNANAYIDYFEESFSW